MRKIIFFILIFISIISCKENNVNRIDVSNIDVNFKIKRFDIDFYSTTPNTLNKTKKEYPLLFPPEHDSVWINKINNKDEQELFNETQKVFGDFSEETKQIENLCKHIKYYDKSFQSPNVITMLTNIDYDNRVVYADSILLISLDAYLGAKHPFYNDYPEYIRQNNHKNHLIVDVANAIINKKVMPTAKRNFIDKMIFEGKKMYLLDLFLPGISDREKIGYSPEKYDWAKTNEEEVWKYFIEKDVLYSTDTKLNRRFLDLAPFSKFYSEDDSLSPGRIGVWIGWQIVRSYMRNNDVSLPELLQKSEDEIFKNSKYKPKR
ncbi:gliding motility lipoprotein GldB [Tenacibaculum sp. IB213877]|uniref:gliding motility lipoprotein GldB n=1 Tax=Tenacibaculum sp. IB213877 TaxID=3097351 RepID=UPI002A59895A|nr:gliding motility lipoprotein GldB [Tenacibaculum sp. IB213877]MDY0781610.1 gliding motility lipoprotein GldB [Tenacibaculum sp. IB213877]